MICALAGLPEIRVISGDTGASRSTSAKTTPCRCHSILLSFMKKTLNSVARLFGNLKGNRFPSLLLSHGRFVEAVTLRSDIANLKGDQITSAKLAVDRQIKQR